MKVYNQDKTIELTEYDLEKGYLKDDVLITHYDEVPYIEEQGHYETIREYSNGGKDVEWIVDVKGQEYQPARDDKEEIQLYIPYTVEELEEIKKNKLRAKREHLLKSFDTYKTNIAYGIITESDEEHNDIVAWYKRLLDLNEEAINNIPSKISYYL